ncbi:MAG: alkaline phosphatase family protein [Cyanobacteria bacterium SZAS TMP-1]|nr:alkaline phosphatase family protein [Cyanobacteria bacterium SZAS TMP-1]
MVAFGKNRVIGGALLLLIMAGNALSAYANAPAGKPKLVVLIVAQALTLSGMNRFADKFGSGGLRYLSETGANFTNCRFASASAQSASGSATIVTGAYPWAHGIISDQWFDRRKGKTISCVADESSQMVGANAPAASSKFLQGTTIGDQMKLATNGRSKVFSIGVNDTQALMLGGRLANMALWFDSRTGNFVTGSQYTHDLPTWAKAFNDQRQAEKYIGKPWQRLLAENQYGSATRDDYQYERALPADGKAFPHVITGPLPGEGAYSTLALTPMANQMALDLARDAFEKENLGTHVDPDYLAIGLSAGGNLTEFFGPNSQEAEDLLLRMDQGISGLLTAIDAKVGLNNCLIVFTADSGASAIPEFLKERGLEAGRIDPKSFKTFLDNTLDNRLGQADWIESFDPPHVYLNFKAIDDNKYRQPEVEALAAKVAHSIPGVSEVITSAQLYGNQVPNGPYSEAVRKSYYWGRSGELFVIPKPGFVFSGENTGTANGSPYTYDTQVPLILYGTGVAGGRYQQSTSPADIAATVCGLLGVESPSLCEGQALTPALAQFAGPARARVADAPAAAP